ncbi:MULTISPECIES: MlaD family protein [Mesoflavibacter]|uniref:MlaD family protein n=1 Tax=Mesoflavibacter profundi TaxID=2708110 RepID=A0ABT4RXR8_9FLAO|nr:MULTISPECIES: MlaD family protein [Mesoflavibacter]MDA0176555.1 MlaD family protein [Mesoflavibacter profundi]QIJ90210.1 ABC transporter, substrate-binding protein (cluster 9, phospholipid) [Mesoflavibacter sp. HG96]QIJ92938.1 ABC transporter, substrate-binding protein (cluster 9, phospholipid) [Mesoflavibacter sp. HG37]
MKISKEIKAALIVILGVFLFVFGFNYLKGNNILENDDVYYTEFDYNALSKSSSVTVKGNPVGKVKDIVYDINSGKTRVSFTVDDNIKFSKNSTIRLYKPGLMDNNALAIIFANDNQYAKNGDFLKSEVEQGLVDKLTGNFSELSTDLDSTLKSADTLLINLNGLVTDTSENGLKNTIAELNSTLKSFKNLSYSINGVVSKNDENIAQVLQNFKQISEDLTVLTTDLKEAQLSKSIEKLEGTLTNVNALLASVENGEGSLGKLLKDDKLYNNLEGAALQMEQLLQDMKLNPKRYVHFSLFGKKPKRYDAEGNEIEDNN